MHRGTRTGWQLFVPIGAGLAFLALYGGAGTDRNGVPVTDAGNVDVMAHLFGLVAGVFLGALLFAVGIRRGTPGRVQAACAIGAVGLLAVAWLLAARA